MCVCMYQSTGTIKARPYRSEGGGGGGGSVVFADTPGDIIPGERRANTATMTPGIVASAFGRLGMAKKNNHNHNHKKYEVVAAAWCHPVYGLSVRIFYSLYMLHLLHCYATNATC